MTELSERLNTPVRILRAQEEIEAYAINPRETRAKGISRIKRGGSLVAKIAILLPNNANLPHVDNTVVHEIVGHKGLRAFIGEERFEEFLGEVYDHASDSIRKRILEVE